MNYVLGFVFNEEKDKVLLIRKDRPAWQAGKLNGVGGKIEKDEIAAEAMKRECLEETGLDVKFHMFGQMDGFADGPQDWKVVLWSGTADINEAQSLTDEPLEIYNVKMLPNDVIPNLHWLIPMALEDAGCFYAITEV